MERAVHPVKDLRALTAIYRRIKQYGFHVVHAHSSKAGVLGRVAARMADVPVVIYSPHAFSFAGPEQSVRTGAYRLIERMAGRLGDGIIADSPSEMNLALRHGIGGSECVWVIPPGIPAQEPVTEQRYQAARRFLYERGFVRSGQRIVTFIGRLAPQKDPLTFLYGARLLSEQVHGVSFLVVGDGPLREKCLRTVQKSASHDTIVLTGWRRDYEHFLAASDVVVIASQYEGLPYILLEAMAQGKPVVATAVAGNRDVIVPEKNGILVPPQDPRALADACRKLLEQPERARRIGRAAHERVVEGYSMRKTISLTEEVYENLMQNRQHRYG
jgi:glycosyltransferase involved in cell wall biosynthesis